MKIWNNILNGNYINFSVFSFFEDHEFSVFLQELITFKSMIVSLTFVFLLTIHF